MRWLASYNCLAPVDQVEIQADILVVELGGKKKRKKRERETETEGKWTRGYKGTMERCGSPGPHSKVCRKITQSNFDVHLRIWGVLLVDTVSENDRFLNIRCQNYKQVKIFWDWQWRELNRPNGIKGHR